MHRSTSLSWVILFWAIGVPLFFGGPWLGILGMADSPPAIRALWILGPPAFGFAVMALRSVGS